MLLTITESYESVPPGNYPATFLGMTQIDTQKGKAYRWAFRTESGKDISGLSDAERPPTTRNKSGKWLCALATKPIQAGASIDPEQYVNKRYLVIVNGDSKLETFTALQA